MFILFILFFKYILLIMLLQLTHFLPFISLHPTHPPTRIPPFRTCPWVVHINSLASAFPILSLTSPCLFSTYHLCYLLSVPSPHSPLPFPAGNPPCNLHFSNSVPVLVVCLVHFCFCLCFRFGFNNCEFVVILPFVFFIFFLDKSL